MYHTKTQYIISAVAIVALGLIIWGAKSSDKSSNDLVWENTNIPCLTGGHVNLAQHIHQMLSITVDGVAEAVPANIGISDVCMAEVHTHDTTGKIHIETVLLDTHHTLADFFTVWGRSIEREGYTLVAMINGVVAADPASHILADDDVIHLAYTSK